MDQTPPTALVLHDRLLIVVSGPGGAGKGTLVRRLQETDPRLWLSRSWSSRAPRDGEDPESYHFVTSAEFDEHVEAGGFLEWVDFLDYRQGTPLPDPPEGMDVVFEIDVFGGEAIAARYRSPLLIFVDTPSVDEQRARLVGRGDPPEKVESRLERGHLEREKAAQLGYVTVINDDLERAASEIAGLIQVARAT